MRIVSLVLKCLPANLDEVRAEVSRVPGASVTCEDAQGRMVVVLEDGEGYAVSDSIIQVHQARHVMSVTLAYEYGDEALLLEETEA